MNYTFYELAMLFFTYSFLAWLAETAVATVKVRNFRNRGFASGPFCFLYGSTGAILTVFLQELKGDALFLFLGSMAVATAVEWFAGKRNGGTAYEENKKGNESASSKLADDGRV